MVNIYDLRLTNEQMKEILGVSHMTLFRWREKGLPYVMEGSNVRYKLADVEKWLEEQGATIKTSLK